MTAHRPFLEFQADDWKLKGYIDTADWWIGVYRSPTHWYFCPLPCVVFRWKRRARQS